MKIPYEKLERHFHEPVRLAILALLANSAHSVPFTRLREELELTFGNLDRHLKVLADAGVIEVEKDSFEGRSRTLVSLTADGREGFLAYLDSLEQVLAAASKGMKKHSKRADETSARNAGHRPATA